jgi:hypothetical protein
MAGRDIPDASAAITVNGTADGYITVADNTPFIKGATAFIAPTNGSAPGTEVLITEIASGGKIGIRVKPTLGVEYRPNYGRSSCTAFTTSYTIYQQSGFVYNA